MLGSLKVHAGEFKDAKGANFVAGQFVFATGVFSSEKLPAAEVAELDVASEESVKRMGGAIGWGLVGGLALGGIGAIAGLLAGGRSKEVTFVCKFKDGRRLLATTDSKTYTEIQAACF
jgi:hypothetical protein